MKYEVRSSKELGRYLVAKCDLRAGEMVFTDKPFVIGPQNDSLLLCFRCYQAIGNKFSCCKVCSAAPVCPGGACRGNSYNWHVDAECSLFSKWKCRGVSALSWVQQVPSLMILRCLLRQQEDPESWAQFMSLETHLEERRGTDIWRFYDRTVVEFIESLGLCEDLLKDELVQRACAAVDVNSFEVRGPGSPGSPGLPGGVTLRGVYLRAALLAHHCVGNTHIAVGDDHVMTVRAATDVKMGDLLYFNYIDALQGTAERQERLLVGKYFRCRCERCEDPTELSTHLSSAACGACGAALVAPGRACAVCGARWEHAAVQRRVEQCWEKLHNLNKGEARELEEYIRWVSGELSPHHYLALDAKLTLAGLLRDTIHRQPRPTRALMQRQVQLCEDVLRVLDKLLPQISRVKAITLYELHSTMLQLARKLFDAREISAGEMLERYQQAERTLKRSLEMLFLEPGGSPEGVLCAHALRELRELKSCVAGLQDGGVRAVHIREIRELAEGDSQ